MNINLTLIGQSITFFVFVAFCWKYVWPALISVMEEREQKIAAGLEAAERADKDLELAQKKATEQLREAKEQAAAIVEQANKRATQLIDEAKEQAVAEADRVKAAAEAEVEQMTNRAKEELRGKVAALALAGASQVLQANIDEAANAELVNKLAAEL
ncbi:F0F1 ATP synthase subunit B [Marinibactrum halimedae]|uniref:ATP synthase subunit b n=1 Tax=Marinibactrum halimedae TaxID=1444977 RepID=A0AA37TDZ7_9GAMM|nr:F0F1 ATP synthase subunit B [Marinibactrum halimedae]MCD9460006.1 F0F1 ATP synthase subunit B [Marinibactrum halimedae]GLS28225.1 ATP synthase subunit b [Marinibactrum halimedae]